MCDYFTSPIYFVHKNELITRHRDKTRRVHKVEINYKCALSNNRRLAAKIITQEIFNLNYCFILRRISEHKELITMAAGLPLHPIMWKCSSCIFWSVFYIFPGLFLSSHCTLIFTFCGNFRDPLWIIIFILRCLLQCSL